MFYPNCEQQNSLVITKNDEGIRGLKCEDNGCGHEWYVEPDAENKINELKEFIFKLGYLFASKVQVEESIKDAILIRIAKKLNWSTEEINNKLKIEDAKFPARVLDED